MKKLISLVLCFALVAGLVPSAFAASPSMSFEAELASDLKALGLFKGVSDTDFALGREPSRVEALVMLVRVLGKESEALSKGGKHPFSDVPQWADKYVGYAYENKLTNGVSATKFGSSSVASGAMYLTFVLRALGYSDTSGADFTWDNPYTLARETGVLFGNPDMIKFLRADVVLVSYAALEANMKGSEQTLAEKLIASGAFTKAQYDANYDLYAFEKSSTETEKSAEKIYEECSPAVFYIEVYDSNNRVLGSGSGFFIDSDGTAVTNYHVIEGASSAKIKLAENGNVYKVTGVYDYNVKNDWAILKIDGSGFKYLEIDETPATGGSTVFAIGSPLGLENTISQGLVSNANRILDGVSYIQISAAISPGSSGGALINKYGKVIGITSAGFEGGQNLNLALPISVIKGYSNDRAHALSAIGESDNRALGNLDIDALDEEEAAFELLKLWVLNNSNTTVGDDLAYQENIEDGDSRLSQIISVDEINNCISFAIAYASGEQSLISVISFYAEKDTTVASCAYYDYDVSDSYIARGVSRVDKEEFSPDLEVYFTEFEGDSDLRWDLADTAASMWCDSIDFADRIFKKNLSGYGYIGVESLGFYNN